MLPGHELLIQSPMQCYKPACENEVLHFAPHIEAFFPVVSQVELFQHLPSSCTLTQCSQTRGLGAVFTSIMPCSSFPCSFLVCFLLPLSLMYTGSSTLFYSHSESFICQGKQRRVCVNESKKLWWKQSTRQTEWEEEETEESGSLKQRVRREGEQHSMKWWCIWAEEE